MKNTTSVLPSPFPAATALSNTTHTAVPDRRGWVGQPDERGTLDIIWSCVSTLIICLWTMLHLNVPASCDKSWAMFWRKARWMLLGLLAPELPMVFACGQWASAQRSVAQMGNPGWTIVHSLYADGGGFLLQPPDTYAFPVTAKQIHYLVTEEYIPMPTITQREIWDKSKADKFAKTITGLQTLWLMTQIIARAIQRLPVTPLELSTLSIVCCSLTTLYFWLSKPLDVNATTLLTTSTPISAILLRAGASANDPFRDTPLDFVEPRTYMSSKWYERLLRLILRLGLQSRPLARIPNDRDPQLSTLKQHLFLGVAAAAFASIHLVGGISAFRRMGRRCCGGRIVLLCGSCWQGMGVQRCLCDIGVTLRG
ncbi:MAG: hypothetical protein M1839_002749 [Geoglossum umbratile]|nr:MAG: hypothetical protein M1839_002749 [Geoglossum umbratile]